MPDYRRLGQTATLFSCEEPSGCWEHSTVSAVNGRRQCFGSHIGLLPFRHSVHGAGACGHRLLQVKR